MKMYAEKGRAGVTSGEVNTGSEQEHNPFVLESYYIAEAKIAQILLIWYDVYDFSYALTTQRANCDFHSGEEFNETLGKGVFHEPKGPDLH